MSNTKQDNSLTGNALKAPRRTGAKKGSGKTTHRTTKKQELIRLLAGKTGADVAGLSDRLGWQQHSVRAALTGLRKAGYDIQKEPGPGGKLARYRIFPGPVSSPVSDAEVGK